MTSPLDATGELLVSIAHDLNNALNTVLLRGTLLQADPTCTEKQRDHIEAILRTIRSASIHVDRLEELARSPRRAQGAPDQAGLEGPAGAPSSAMDLEAAPPTRSARPEERVLLIDEDPAQLMMAKAIIELEERQVTAAPTVAHALAELRAGERFGLVICDADTAGRHDLAIAEAVIALSPEAKVYLLAARPNELADGDSRVTGASGVLQKPLNLDRLRSILPH